MHSAQAAVLPLSHWYKADRIYQLPCLLGTRFTDTIHACVQSKVVELQWERHLLVALPGLTMKKSSHRSVSSILTRTQRFGVNTGWCCWPFASYTHGNEYAQIFANEAYLATIYPMDAKKKAGDALRTFCLELGVPENWLLMVHLNKLESTLTLWDKFEPTVSICKLLNLV